MWKVSDFRKVNKPWGNFRKVIGELPIANTPASILLMKENDDGRKSIAVHDMRNHHAIVKLGFYWVETEADEQKALDVIFDTLMSGKAR